MKSMHSEPRNDVPIGYTRTRVSSHMLLDIPDTQELWLDSGGVKDHRYKR